MKKKYILMLTLFMLMSSLFALDMTHVKADQCYQCGASYYWWSYNKNTSVCTETTLAQSSCNRTTCAAGYYLDGTAVDSGHCVTCPEGSWCPGVSGPFGTTAGLNSCPAYYSNSDKGSTKESDCKISCVAGTHVNTAKGTCTACPSGYTSTARDISYGNTSNCQTIQSYSCPAGKYFNRNTLNCVTCEAGYYCPGFSSRTLYTSSDSAAFRYSCPSGTSSSVGSDDENDCTASTTVHCNAGYYIAIGASSCNTPCPDGAYCPAGDYTPSSTQTVNVTYCARINGLYTHSSSPRSSRSDCYVTCPANTYVASSTSTSCQACPTGTTSSEHIVHLGSTSSCSTSSGGSSSGTTPTDPGNGGSGSGTTPTNPGNSGSGSGTTQTTVSVTGVTLAPKTSSIEVGATVQLTATVAPTNASNKSVTFASSDATVATVSASGQVTGVKVGTTTITATTADGSKTDTATITVVAATGENKTITFDANGGAFNINGTTQSTHDATGASTQTLLELLPVLPTRTGYKLVRWSTEAEGGYAVALENPLSDISVTTLYAQWEVDGLDPSQPISTLTYNSNGGTACAPSTKQVNTGNAWGTLCRPTFKGYTFNGWFTAKTGGSKITSTTVANGDLTVYAQWRKATPVNPKTGIFTPIAAILLLGIISSVTFLIVKRRSAGI